MRVTIDVTPMNVGYLTKQQMADNFGCSTSTIKRIIGLLRSAVPDEFDSVPGATHYNKRQQQMCQHIAKLLNGGRGLTYSQIENEYLIEGWPS